MYSVYISCYHYHYFLNANCNRLTGALFRLSGMLHVCTDRLINALFRLTRVTHDPPIIHVLVNDHIIVPGRWRDNLYCDSKSMVRP